MTKPLEKLSSVAGQTPVMLVDIHDDHNVVNPADDENTDKDAKELALTHDAAITFSSNTAPTTG